MCMGIPEGRVISMGGSHMGKVMSDYLKKKLKLAVPIVVPIAIFYFQLSKYFIWV